jgi:hypothetical protein
LRPAFFAASEKGTNLRIGEAGIATALLLTEGMIENLNCAQR